MLLSCHMALRASYSPTTGRQGDIQGKEIRGAYEMRKSPHEASPPGQMLLIKFLAWVS